MTFEYTHIRVLFLIIIISKYLIIYYINPFLEFQTSLRPQGIPRVYIIYERTRSVFNLPHFITRLQPLCAFRVCVRNLIFRLLRRLYYIHIGIYRPAFFGFFFLLSTKLVKNNGRARIYQMGTVESQIFV